MYCADIGGQSRLASMSHRHLALAATLVLATAAAPAQAVQQPASLHTKPFTLTTDATARKVNVGVTPDGTGHFAWDVSSTADDPLVYCRVPRGQRKSQVTQTTPLPLAAFGEPQVLVSGSAVT